MKGVIDLPLFELLPQQELLHSRYKLARYDSDLFLELVEYVAAVLLLLVSILTIQASYSLADVLPHVGNRYIRAKMAMHELRIGQLNVLLRDD